MDTPINRPAQLNHLIFSGNLGRLPELKRSSNGSLYANFQVLNNPIPPKESATATASIPNSFWCSVWVEQRAQYVMEYLGTGDLVTIVGSLRCFYNPQNRSQVTMVNVQEIVGRISSTNFTVKNVLAHSPADLQTVQGHFDINSIMRLQDGRIKTWEQAKQELQDGLPVGPSWAWDNNVIWEFQKQGKGKAAVPAAAPMAQPAPAAAPAGSASSPHEAPATYNPPTEQSQEEYAW